MKHIHLNRAFAIFAMLGVIYAFFHINHAAAKEQAVAYTATTQTGVSVTLALQRSSCANGAMDATYTAPKEDPVHGCWKPINKYQVLVLWDNGEVVAYNISNFSPDKSA